MKNHVQWAITSLEKRGDYLNALPELVQQAPWSEVFRISTRNGFFYLKKTPRELFLEVHIIQMLKENFHTSVPTIIANNPQESCFLMEDAGIPLQQFFKQGFKQDIFIGVLENYAKLQLTSVLDIPDILSMGVPDWGVEKLPSLYTELVEQARLLQQLGLTHEEIQQCQDLIPKFKKICERLTQYNVPNTFSQCDFHDNNVLIHPETHQTALIDLGEMVITHPFFSWLNMLQRIKKNCNLTLKQYEQLEEQAFKLWLKLESLEHLKEIFVLIQKCWLIHAILGIYRLMQCVDSSSFHALALEGKFSSKLRLWINEAINFSFV
jgi:hypothetical protein